MNIRTAMSPDNNSNDISLGPVACWTSEDKQISNSKLDSEGKKIWNEQDLFAKQTSQQKRKTWNQMANKWGIWRINGKEETREKPNANDYVWILQQKYQRWGSSEPQQLKRVCTGKVRVWHLLKHCVLEKHDIFIPKVWLSRGKVRV